MTSRGGIVGRTAAALAVAAVLLATLVASPAAAAETVTYEDLIGRMADLRRLATAPEPGERLVRFSSADPNFRGNLDFGHVLRSDGAESVLAEVAGPGAIVRIWSANPRGTLRIYVDTGVEADSPAIEAAFEALLRGDVLPFAYPFAGVRGKGGNLYFPIPFRRSCRVTLEDAHADTVYYHVEAKIFPPGTDLPSFSPEALGPLAAAIDRTARILGDPEAAFDGAPPATVLEEAVEADRPLVARIEGPAAIRRLRVSFDRPPSRETLRDLVLEIRWDGEAAPAVRTPLGDFFGTAPGPNPYRSLPLEVRSDGTLVSRWFMPFERSAEIAIRNEGGGRPRARIEVWTEPYAWGETSLRFHASWRYETEIEELALWPFAEIGGTGRYVGTALSVHNPHRSWWGEGDEFIWIDGEETPSVLGTGTEDYFGYAWYATDLFSHAFHAQSLCEGPGNRGYTSLARFHVLDEIPFRESLRGVFEIYWRFRPDYAAVAYWYARPGGSLPPPLPPAAARRPRPPPRLLGIFGTITEALVVLFTILVAVLWFVRRGRRGVSFGPRRRIFRR